MSVAPSIPYFKKITGKMTGNAKFTDLATETAALGSATGALDTANTNYEKSKSDTAQLLTLRDNAYAATSDAAHTLANGAQKITTDASDLQSGGWDLVSDATACRRTSGSGPRRRADRGRRVTWARNRAAPSPACRAGWNRGFACRPTARRDRATGPAPSSNARRDGKLKPENKPHPIWMRPFFWLDDFAVQRQSGLAKMLPRNSGCLGSCSNGIIS